MVEPNNPEKLLEKINELIENEELAQKLAENSYDFVMKNLTWEILLPNYVKFYKDLIK